MIQYSQRDRRWNCCKLGFAEGSQTIGSHGSLLTTCASVLSSCGFVILPKDLNEIIKGINGFTGSLMQFDALPKLFAVKVDHYQCNCIAPMESIDEYLDNNSLVIVEIDASVRPSFQNHWVIIYKRHGDEYYISDPWTMNPEKEFVTLESRYGFTGRTAEIIKQIVHIEPVLVCVT